MGSGCQGNNINGYFGTPIPDKGIKYTGPSIPALDICTGDFLNEIEAIILQKLIDYSTGIGISLPNINLEECEFIQVFIWCCSEDKSLEKLFTILFKAVCTLKADIDAVEDKVDEILNITFDLKCISVSNPTLGNIINAIITEFCLLQDRVEVLEDTVISLQNQINELSNSLTETITEIINELIGDFVGNYILNNINSCKGNGLVKSGTGDTAQLLFTGMVPPLCPIPYVGPLSNFDNTGAGLSNKGYCGWYICNGLNSTPDMRGYTFSSATNSVPGGTLDSRVSASATNIGDKNGELKHKLVLSELPSSSSSGAGTHKHDMVFKFKLTTVLDQLGVPGSLRKVLLADTSGAGLLDATLPTQYASTGGTGSGSDEPHENRQPTFYGVWIIRFN